MTRQGGFDRPDFSPRKSVVFPELYRPCRTVEIEYRFTAPSDDVNMRPTVLDLMVSGWQFIQMIIDRASVIVYHIS